MNALDDLITAAVQLAGTEDTVSHGARLWQSEGGRRCPLGWEDCSQAVYVDLKTGAYDYGEPGGPGHADCVRNCAHGMQPCHDDEGDDVHETPNVRAKQRPEHHDAARADGLGPSA